MVQVLFPLQLLYIFEINAELLINLACQSLVLEGFVQEVFVQECLFLEYEVPERLGTLPVIELFLDGNYDFGCIMNCDII